MTLVGEVDVVNGSIGLGWKQEAIEGNTRRKKWIMQAINVGAVALDSINGVMMRQPF